MLWSGYKMSIMTLLRRRKLWSLTPQGYSSEKQEHVTQHRSRKSCERLLKKASGEVSFTGLSEHPGNVQQTVSGVDTTSPVSLGPCGLFRRRQISGLRRSPCSSSPCSFSTGWLVVSLVVAMQVVFRGQWPEHAAESKSLIW